MYRNASSTKGIDVLENIKLFQKREKRNTYTQKQKKQEIIIAL